MDKTVEFSLIGLYIMYSPILFFCLLKMEKEKGQVSLNDFMLALIFSFFPIINLIPILVVSGHCLVWMVKESERVILWKKAK